MSDTNPVEVGVGCGLLLVMTPIGIALNGWTLSVLWGWFIVPTFGAIPLGVWQAIGLSCVTSFLFYRYNDCKKEDRDFLTRILIIAAQVLVRPGIALLFGWMIHRGMR